jgi:trehalose/maltose hydrolase-like predicted phosphorylase
LVSWILEVGQEIIHGDADVSAKLLTESLSHNCCRFDIAGVMGPDEYHDAYPEGDEPGLRNNAYANVLASRVVASRPRRRGLRRTQRR